MSDDLDLAQFREVFLQEAKENLQILNQSLLVLEKNPEDKDNINAVFRVAHTVKGMAATMGYEKITELSHHMEDVLEKIRNGKVHATARMCDVLFECMDMLGELINGVESSESRQVFDLAPIIQKLHNLAAEGKPEEPAETPAAAPAAESPKPADASALPAIPNLEAPKIPEIPVLAPVAAQSPGQEPKAQKQAAKTSSMTETIRVSVPHLDTLMNLVGEMVINKGRLEEISVRHKIPELEEALSFFDRLGTDLQAAVLKMRMVSVSHIFDRYPRMVRDVARKLGKEVELELIGADIEIDRMLLEQINEPVIHILRNAVDHGLESTEERKLAGKKPSGTITLSAERGQSAVIIEVRDDGKGMDPEKLKKTAITRGILTPESAALMSDKDAFFLICDQRFSTAQTVTDISGRGVGMDVVKSTVESINGSLQIESVKGKGSVFTLKLPLSLAIIRVLIVQVHNENYAIPLSNISEIVSITTEDISMVNQKETMFLRDHVLPLVRVDNMLDVPVLPQEGTNSDNVLKVVVVETAQRKVGFVVTDLVGRKEVVVKTLPGICKNAKIFSGATILGDGSVILILDIANWVMEHS